jgi:hypothetical protein
LLAEKILKWSKYECADAGVDSNCLGRLSHSARSLSQKLREAHLRTQREGDEFQLEDFIAAMRAEVKLWYYHAPANQRGFLAETLRNIADKIDEMSESHVEAEAIVED